MTHLSLGQRSGIGSAVVAVCMLIGPLANSAPPVRTPVVVEGWSIPAGEGCPDFAVNVAPNDRARRTVTEFGDGRVVINGHGTGTVTNADTGASFTQHSAYMITERVDLENGVLHSEGHGRLMIAFWPGDMGPDGSVVTEAMLLSVTGHHTLTMDLETLVYDSFNLDGRVLEDVCAVLGNS